jgi:phosphoglycerate dehydrogenase-like enzyme
MTSTTPAAPRIAVLPEPTASLSKAITAAGGTVVPLSAAAQGLVVDFAADRRAVKAVLDEHPDLGWIQLPSAGIEAFADALAAHPDRTWTSAKGAYALPVAEHALALTLALLRNLPERVRATSWGTASGTSRHGLKAVVIGAGGVGLETVRLLKVFTTEATVVRRQDIPVPSADQTVTTPALAGVLPDADVVIIAAALTAGTARLIGAAELELMKPGSILVNIARGGLVDTEALVAALAAGRIAGAALDVTDPEPLPEGHPLWSEPRCLITPHTADTLEMIRPLLADRVGDNVRRLAAGEGLEGLVDAQAGY